jgi:hypothetical protein
MNKSIVDMMIDEMRARANIEPRLVILRSFEPVDLCEKANAAAEMGIAPDPEWFMDPDDVREPTAHELVVEGWERIKRSFREENC